jgi:hypothetical protein
MDEEDIILCWQGGRLVALPAPENFRNALETSVHQMSLVVSTETTDPGAILHRLNAPMHGGHRYLVELVDPHGSLTFILFEGYAEATHFMLDRGVAFANTVCGIARVPPSKG